MCWQRRERIEEGSPIKKRRKKKYSTQLSALQFPYKSQELKISNEKLFYGFYKKKKKQRKFTNRSLAKIYLAKQD
jgi:hypothetical protein